MAVTVGSPSRPAGCHPLPILRREAGRGTRLRELWEYRELLYFLVWRDVKVRYKQTALGVSWAVLQPVLTMVVFSVFLGRLAGLPSDGVPYPVFAYAALLPWQLFAGALTGVAGSVVASRGLVTRVYFPRLVVPLAAALSGVVDFVVACGVLAVLMGYYGIPARPAVLAAPVFAALAVVTAVAAGLWLAVLNVRYRDVRYTVPFLVQLWMFATPVVYPASLVPEPWRALYALNPMVGVIEGFRWALLGTSGGPDVSTAVSAAVIAVILVAGVVHFQRAQATFADVV